MHGGHGPCINVLIMLRGVMFVPFCFQTVNDTSPEVREASFIALGTILKVVGEKFMNQFLSEIDPIKMTKVSQRWGRHSQVF